MSLDQLPFGVAHHMGLVPLMWLLLLQWRGRDPGIAWWWLAGAFAVSWVADTAAHWGNSWLVGLVYPMSQAVIVGFVFLSRREVSVLTATLLLAGFVDMLWNTVQGPDILLRTVAWGAVVGIVYPLKQLGRLRTSLLVYFSLGLLAWYGYAARPGWPTWIAYQSVRLIGILLFCRASLHPSPELKLSRA